MLKELKYNGLTAAPSDYECPDGDLSGMLNLVPEDGDLKPILPPTVMYNVGEGYNVVYIHTTSKITHYVCLSETDNTLSWFDENTDTDGNGIVKKTTLKTLGVEDEVYQVTAIGNTLLALCESGTHYFLWKSDEYSYLYLGTHLPELALSFGLRGTMERLTSDLDDKTNSYYITEMKNRVDEGDQWGKISDEENVSTVTSGVMAKVNKFIADKGTNAGKFVLPFFVRYAYRLYDDSLVMHSSPVLMLCSSGSNPQVVLDEVDGNGSEVWKVKYNVIGFVHQLDYTVIGNVKDKITNWKDIIKSVDVFISKPIYTFDQSGDITYILNDSTEGDTSYAICGFTGGGNSSYVNSKLGWHSKVTFNEAMVAIDDYDAVNGNTSPYTLGFPKVSSARDVYLTQRVKLPEKSLQSLTDDVSDNSAFYLLKQINIEDLNYGDERAVIDVADDYLQSLVNREVMTDDYDSHDTIIPKYAFGYNNRINYANIEKILYNDYNVAALLPYTYAYVKWAQKHGGTTDHTTYQNKTETYTIYFVAKQDGGDIVVKGTPYNMGYLSSVLWLYYPNTSCHTAYVKRERDGVTTIFKVAMKTHDFLNGAYYNGELSDLKWSGYKEPTESTIAERTYDVPNKVYTSDVNNPFHFDVTNITTVGTGKILGLSTAAKALSQGQFGSFPLYCFTDDGVWAMEVSSSTGAFSARQPITRDVCINAESITQLDNAVIFATDRGLMLIQGSDTACITDTIWSRESFSPLLLPSGESIVNSAGFTAEQVGYVRFSEFMQDCGIIYDYLHQRVIVFNKNHKYSYVFSLKDKAWGMATSEVTRSVNQYPNACAMTSAHQLVSFSDEDDSVEGVNTILWTRPLKMDAPDILKTTDTIIQRGFFQKDNVKQVLYGSRDLENWSLVWSSTDRYLRGFHGTPYKYFRIGLYGTLAPRKSLFGATIQFTPKYTNQPR